MEEAQANQADIFDYAGKSTVAEDYRAFIEELQKYCKFYYGLYFGFP